MKIERVCVDGFGRLVGYDTGSEPLPRLVVVLGPNEAGKSTLFHFLTTALYGFKPATREANPYVPWGAEEAGGRIEISLDGGGCVEVTRRLRSQPSGRMKVDGRAEELRNRALPWVDHVPRTVFRQVFAVRLSDLAGLDEETWGRVQDRILGSMGASDLLPAREVVAALEREAGELWRPHRRGNQRIRELQGEIRELRSVRRQALERDQRMRSLVEEHERSRARLEQLREQRSRALVALERVQALLPVRRQLQRITELREAAGPPGTLRSLPPDPTDRLARLRGRSDALAARKDELAEELAGPEATERTLGEAEATLLARSDQVNVFLGRVAALAPDRARAQALDEEVRDLDRRLESASRDVLSVPWSEVPTGPLVALPIAELKTRIGRAEAARRDGRVAELAAAASARGEQRPSGAWSGGLVGLLSGVLLLALGLSDARALVTVAGAALTVTALALLWRGTRSRAAPAEGTESAGDLDEASTREEVLAILGDVPVRPHVLDEPDAALLLGLRRIQELVLDRQGRRGSSDEIGRRLAELDSEAESIATSLGLDGTADAAVTATLLDRELRRAERVREAAVGAEREARRVRRELERADAEARRVHQDLVGLEDALGALGDGDVDRGAEVAGERLRDQARAEQLRDELERDHPDLPELEARIADAEEAGESWTVDDEDLARRRADIERFGEEIERLAAGAERLDAELVRLQELETVDSVDGRIAGLEDDVARLVRARDRRWALAQLVREADRRFREEHQPDLMRRASAYLEHLTDGRYERIVAEEVDGGDLFHVVGSALPAPMPLTPPVSTGTLEQAYLALRFAIVDHLDQGGERLPLFVDEVFVNWDPERRARGLDLLGSLARTRQLFVFTCHPDMARELEARGGRVLSLAGR